MEELKDIWRGVLKVMEQTIPRTTFVTWFQNTAPLRYEQGIFVVGLPHVFAMQQVPKLYGSRIADVLKTALSDFQNVVFEVDSALANSDDERRIELKTEPTKKVRKVSGGQEVSFGDGLRSKVLQQRYKLDSYITGPNNRLPYAACQAVSSNPGGIYNPLFLYGKVGLGKTHLLQGTGNQIVKNHQDAVVVYITSENFMNEVVEAIRTRRMKDVKEKYRRVDCLIVDDIQFFGRGTSTQEEFFHTFNDLYSAGKQIILSSDRAPKELENLDDRLRSRFGMGMVVEVQSPDYETRLAILQSKCMQEGVIIDPDVLSCIAYHVEDSVRDIEGVLKSIIGMMQLEKIQPTIETALEKIRQFNKAVEIRDNFVPTGGPRSPVSGPARGFVRNIDLVMTTVAKYFNISKQDLVGEDRRKEVLVPRQICMYLIRKELDEAYEKIGADFGGKNHTTVLHACNKIHKMLQTDQRIVRDLSAIRKELGLV
ncbi:MAG: chromosomal replication initiator protein DnaA [Candidatus Gracilibacteria bacterium]